MYLLFKIDHTIVIFHCHVDFLRAKYVWHFANRFCRCTFWTCFKTVRMVRRVPKVKMHLNLYFLKTLDLDIHIPWNTYWDGVWTPKHLLKMLVKGSCLLNAYWPGMTGGFSMTRVFHHWEGEGFFTSYLRAFWLPQKKVVSGLLTGLGWNMIKHWCRFIGWGCKKVWKLEKLGSGFVYW